MANKDFTFRVGTEVKLSDFAGLSATQCSAPPEGVAFYALYPAALPISRVTRNANGVEEDTVIGHRVVLKTTIQDIFLKADDICRQSAMRDAYDRDVTHNHGGNVVDAMRDALAELRRSKPIPTPFEKGMALWNATKDDNGKYREMRVSYSREYVVGRDYPVSIYKIEFTGNTATEAELCAKYPELQTWLNDYKALETQAESDQTTTPAPDQTTPSTPDTATPPQQPADTAN